MALLISGVIVLLIVLFLAQTGILMWVKKLFKIENPTYRNSAKTLIFSGMAIPIVGIILSIINLPLLSNIIGTIAPFLVFHYFLKKYYLSSWKKSLGIYLVFGIMASLLIIVPTRHYVFQPFIVNGGAMSPTYNNGDYLLVNKLSTSFERGDIIVFRYPKDPSNFFIQRIIGLPSEKVDIRDGKVLINGEMLNESYYNGETLPNSSSSLHPDQYFVLGDNRTQSSDSRNWGPITESSIQGKIFFKVSDLIK